jgi:hypothetical protein
MIPQLLWVFFGNGQVFLCLFVRFGEGEVVCKVLCLRNVQRTYEFGWGGRLAGNELFNETYRVFDVAFESQQGAPLLDHLDLEMQGWIFAE